MIACLIIVCALIQVNLAIDLVGCGQTKGCFRIPADCTSIQTCTYAITFTPENDRVRFQLAAPFDFTFSPTKYVALGLSETKSMSGSFVVACTHDGNTGTNNFEVAMTDGYVLTHQDKSSLPEGYLEMFSNEFVNDMISCEFTIKSELPESVNYAKSFDQNLFMLLAKGNTRSELLTQHTRRDVSSSSISLFRPELATPTLG